MPLSYIAGTIEGNPDIYVELEDGQTLAADEALQKAGIEPVTLGPKEGLGLVNGTACSAALGALVINEAHQLAFITQALTAMAVEVSILILIAF
jgi:phenylalanine ammonia-lyase